MEPVKLNVSLRSNDRLNITLDNTDQFNLTASDIIHYATLIGKPSINGVTLIGNKTSSDLGIDVGIHSGTTEYWNSQLYLIGEANHIYVYTDYAPSGEGSAPAIKIGDGTSYLIDAPFVYGNTELLTEHINDHVVHITNAEREFWNNKITCFVSQVDGENLILTKGGNG